MRRHSALAFTAVLTATLALAQSAHAIDINPFGYLKDAVEAAVEDRSA